MDDIAFSDLEPGHIVWALIDDPQGGNKKERPAIILERDYDENNKPICFVIGGTTSPVDPDRAKFTVLLPGSDRGFGRGDPLTGLKKDTRFCAFWIEPVYCSNVTATLLKRCPDEEFFALEEMVRALDQANANQSMLN